MGLLALQGMQTDGSGDVGDGSYSCTSSQSDCCNA
jgi:hypothetical protein